MDKHTPEHVPLSKRIRPNSEAAQWVVDEVLTLEAQLATVTEERDTARRKLAASELVRRNLNRAYLVEKDGRATIRRDVRIADLEKQLAEERAKVESLREEMSALYIATVSIMETARDIMVGLGRPCDSIEQMEKQDHRLIRAREALAATATTEPPKVGLLGAPLPDVRT